jgi:ABC-2 type transport system ATP-binding protein
MIEIVGLQKVIGHNTVVDIETLKVGEGEIAGMVGPVDSGMDVLMEILIGRAAPTMGKVLIAGIDPYADRKGFSRLVGVVFAEDNFYMRLSPQGNLQFYCRLRRLPKARAAEILKKVGLADHADVKMADLPSSLVRRLAFGRAILHNPKVLILAEPFIRSDQASVQLLSEIIRELAGQGATILILSDDDDHSRELCDVIYHLEKGRVVDVIRPQEERRAELPFMIPAKLEGAVALVDPADIFYVFAQEDRAFLQTADGSIPTQFTLAELEKRLSRSGFFRAHRSYLVNLQHVKEVIPFTRDTYSLRLKDEAGTQIPLSKTAARELKELLGY